MIFISDYESWVDAGGGRGTATMREWNVFKQHNPNARLACLDVQPYRTVQAIEREDILFASRLDGQEVFTWVFRNGCTAPSRMGVSQHVSLPPNKPPLKALLQKFQGRQTTPYRE